VFQQTNKNKEVENKVKWLLFDFRDIQEEEEEGRFFLKSVAPGHRCRRSATDGFLLQQLLNSNETTTLQLPLEGEDGALNFS
jgi:hypothetical protein